MNTFKQIGNTRTALCFALGALTLCSTGCGEGTTVQNKWLKVEQEQLLERVQSLGGWNVLQKDCASLAERYKGEPRNWYVQSHWPETNDLPESILALQPVRVEYYPGKMDKYSADNWFNDTDYRIIRITVFNRFYTGPGGSDHPPLGFDIICPPPTGTYHPQRLLSKVPEKYWHYIGLTTNVYEFYGFY